MTQRTFLGRSGAALTTLQLSLIVCPAFILNGYNQANIGGYLTESSWVATFPELDTINTTGAIKSHNSTIQGLTVAVLILGGLFGSLSCSYTGDKFGRRAIISAAGVCTLIGEVLEASAFSLAQFIVGRFILGIGVGQIISMVPVWISETSSAKHRGQHGVLVGVFTCLGYLLESWINLGFFEFHTGSVTWRPPVAIPTVLSVLLMIAIWFLPESPRWLAMRNQSDQAKSVISALKGLPENSVEVDAELTGIEHSLESTSTEKLSNILRNGEDKLGYRFFLCMLLQFYQQWSGTNLVSVYMPIIFQTNLGMSAELSKILSASALTWKFISSFASFFCIDRFGRRALFMISGAGMSTCMIVLAIATSFPSSNHSAQIAAGFFLFLFSTFVPIGFLGANFLYPTEIAPIRLRVAMSSISVAHHWMWNFVISLVTPVAVDTIGYRFYIVFGVIGATIPVVVYFLFPETKGRNLEEINMMFRDSPSVWATVRFAQTRPIALPQEYEKEEAPVHEEDATAHEPAALKQV
ncbi:general substrate transporter [Aspergillus violaceofuscus CBS 115571]|uniref:General substrate transporter n=1 Tax=Aspergillus violaceofuscus (strain CBS 115571) TaxID=1450538 RepID=A0A2V5HNQ3_ASPV1|nr:general substrate transporter [Aspergillus violaceofuscus CBS 115571]